MRFIFFTKTEWAEPPRMRHQLAGLLADAGHEVIFFQRPIYPWQNSRPTESSHPRIHLYRHRQTLHHKLRLNNLLHYVNAAFEKQEILTYIGLLKIGRADVIVNFNYDYFFLREMFPEQKLITIINDDFWSRAIAGYERPLKSALAMTCKTSDVVLAVSPPLAKQLETFCDPVLFYPWADIPYKAPASEASRNTLLFWGYINSKVDLDYVKHLVELIQRQRQDIKVLFVGPTTRASKRLVALKDHPVLEYHPTARLDELPLDRVFAGFIPNRSGVTENDAIVLPNRALQLFARGLPVAITGMPHFLQHPFVFRLGNGLNTDLATLREVQHSFFALQPAVEAFVQANSAEHRLQTFLTYAQ